MQSLTGGGKISGVIGGDGRLGGGRFGLHGEQLGHRDELEAAS
jgi:hypothetical protein